MYESKMYDIYLIIYNSANAYTTLCLQCGCSPPPPAAPGKAREVSAPAKQAGDRTRDAILYTKQIARQRGLV